MLHRGATAEYGFDDGQEGHVKAHHLVFGMVGNPDNLVRVQTRVERVQNPTGTAHTKIQLQMAVAIPGQCSHAVTECDFHLIQRIGHLAGPRAHILIGIAVQITFDAPGNHLSLAVVAFREYEQR